MTVTRVRAATVLIAALTWTVSARLSAQAASGGSSSARDSVEVARVVTAYRSALASGDSAAALSLLAPDAVVLESGDVETREEYRRHHLPADIEFARAVHSEQTPVQVSVEGNAAWAWSSSTTDGSFRGRSVRSAGVELMVLSRRQDGSWQIRAIHWSSHSRRPSSPG